MRDGYQKIERETVLIRQSIGWNSSLTRIGSKAEWMAMGAAFSAWPSCRSENIEAFLYCT